MNLSRKDVTRLPRKARAEVLAQLSEKNTAPPDFALTLNLPWPPSVNHYYVRTQSGGVALGPQAKAYHALVQRVAFSQPRFGQANVVLDVIACPPDARRRDLDNIEKSLIDSLKEACVFDDDFQIKDKRIRFGKRVAGGCVIATVSECKP